MPPICLAEHWSERFPCVVHMRIRICLFRILSTISFKKRCSQLGSPWGPYEAHKTRTTEQIWKNKITGYNKHNGIATTLSQNSMNTFRHGACCSSASKSIWVIAAQNAQEWKAYSISEILKDLCASIYKHIAVFWVYLENRGNVLISLLKLWRDELNCMVSPQ